MWRLLFDHRYVTATAIASKANDISIVDKEVMAFNVAGIKDTYYVSESRVYIGFSVRQFWEWCLNKVKHDIWCTT